MGVHLRAWLVPVIVLALGTSAWAGTRVYRNGILGMCTRFIKTLQATSFTKCAIACTVNNNCIGFGYQNNKCKLYRHLVQPVPQSTEPCYIPADTDISSLLNIADLPPDPPPPTIAWTVPTTTYDWATNTGNNWNASTTNNWNANTTNNWTTTTTAMPPTTTAFINDVRVTNDTLCPTDGGIRGIYKVGDYLYYLCEPAPSTLQMTVSKKGETCTGGIFECMGMECSADHIYLGYNPTSFLGPCFQLTNPQKNSVTSDCHEVKTAEPSVNDVTAGWLDWRLCNTTGYYLITKIELDNMELDKIKCCKVT